MTRIVGGLARGRRLQVPAKGTRPTSDRTREALFNSLDGLLDLDRARVLDLFAGTGAVGLEALSRGAAVAELVESARDAATVLRHNAATVALAGAVVRQQTVESYLGDATVADGFDLVFADPPYDYPAAQLAAVLEQVAGRLVSGAIAVVERAARDDPPDWPTVIQPVKSRRYGDSVLWYGRRD